MDTYAAFAECLTSADNSSYALTLNDSERLGDMRVNLRADYITVKHRSHPGFFIGNGMRQAMQMFLKDSIQ